MDYRLLIGGRELEITNPEKYMWPSYQIRKIDFIKYMIDISAYILPYINNRLITTIRYPNGVKGKSFYQKNKPAYAPNWIDSYLFEKTEYMLINDQASLIYLCNQACLEFHTSFHRVPGEEPTEMVFDLDPSIDDFPKVVEAALRIKEELEHLQIPSYIKTSGATGLQIYIPLQKGHTFVETRKFGLFMGRYLTQRYPKLFTLERLVKNRDNLIYFDYLQHWRGKTLIAPYSSRAHEIPKISTPLLWKEVSTCKPEQFTILNIRERLKLQGDPFSELLKGMRISLKPYLKEIPIGLS